MYKIAILGASGYTGAELIRIITNHPEMEIEVLAAHSKAGLRVDKVFPHLRSLELPTLIKIEDIDYSNIDLCNCALTHKTSQEVIKRIPTDLRANCILLIISFSPNNPGVLVSTLGASLIDTRG